ncbi:MAG: GNAT family N-acetyltransferase, partial [Gammaproteobacteria bacterium]
DSVFVWQVGVAQSARGQGLGGRLLDQLLELDGCKGVQYLEASVTPDNVPSRKLFRGFARRQDAECQELPFFPAEYFPEGHEREDLFRIGPIERPNN